MVILLIFFGYFLAIRVLIIFRLFFFFLIFSIPVRTFFDGLGQGTIAVGVSHDSKYLVTLGIKMPQIVSIWDWTNERDTPLNTISLPLEYGIQVGLGYN